MKIKREKGLLVGVVVENWSLGMFVASHTLNDLAHPELELERLAAIP
jgi:hypothetical protein